MGAAGREERGERIRGGAFVHCLCCGVAVHDCSLLVYRAVSGARCSKRLWTNKVGLFPSE